MYSLEEVAPEGMDFAVNEHAIMALQLFKDLKTSKTENRHLRAPGMQKLVNSLIFAYNLSVRINVFDADADEGPCEIESSEDQAIPTYSIALTGSLSIISLLNAFFRVVQIETGEPVEFLPRQRAAVLLFRKVYPEQFARLEFHPDTGGFSKPGRGLGFSARVQRPDCREVSTVEEAIRVLGVPSPTPMPEELDRQSLSEEAVRVLGLAPDPVFEDLAEEVIDERDDHYYDEESPER